MRPPPLEGDQRRWSQETGLFHPSLTPWFPTPSIQGAWRHGAHCLGLFPQLYQNTSHQKRYEIKICTSLCTFANIYGDVGRQKKQTLQLEKKNHLK